MSDEIRVLIVDDNDDIRNLYAIWLTHDFDVRTAPNGEAVLSSLETPMDLVVLDRNMPGRSGLEVATELREGGLADSILMVSSARREFELSSSPVNGYIQKPASREDVLSAVRSLASPSRSAVSS